MRRATKRELATKWFTRAADETSHERRADRVSERTRAFSPRRLGKEACSWSQA